MMPTPDDSRQGGFLDPFAGIPATEVCKLCQIWFYPGEKWPCVHETHTLPCSLPPQIYGTPTPLLYSQRHPQIWLLLWILID